MCSKAREREINYSEMKGVTSVLKKKNIFNKMLITYNPTFISLSKYFKSLPQMINT